MAVIQSFTNALGHLALNMAWVLMLLWAVERLWPKGSVSLESQLRSIKFWLFYAAATAFIGTAFAVLTQPLDLKPLLFIPFRHWVETSPFSWSIYVAGPLLGIIIYDFFNYWMHRAQHKWFWRQHAIHHSIENLSAVNSYFHWSEDLFRIVAITLPMTLLFGIDYGGATMAATVFLAMWGNYIHSATKLNLGPIARLIIADNRWHRIHHSIEREHFDKNFGTSVTLWDQLFRTAYFPKADEWPAVGVHDVPEAATISEVLWRPFGYQRGNGAVGGVKLAE